MLRPAALLLGRSPSTRRLIRAFEAQGFESWHEPHPEDLSQTFSQFERACNERGWRPSCVHPGLHGWAERTEFPHRVLERGWAPISPSPTHISLFTHRLALLLRAERFGVPHLLLDDEPRSTFSEIVSWVEDRDIGFPFVLKSLKSNSGLGVFVAHSKEDLKQRLPCWLKQLKESFGEVLLYPERYLEAARRVLVPFARYSDGRIQVFSRVECSLQSRFRNLIDFCPATPMSTSIDRRLIRWTEEVAERTRYVGVGLLEYFVEGEEVTLNAGMPRLNLGYHLWEAVSGTRALDWQLDTLDVSGRCLPPEIKAPQLSFGLCARWFAEDSRSGLPSPGWLAKVSIAGETVSPDGYVDVDQLLEGEAEIQSNEDGLLGVLTSVASNRAQAMRQASDSMKEWSWVGSARTNRRLLIEVLEHPFVRENHFHSGFMDEEFTPALLPPLEVVLEAFRLCEQMVQAKDSDQWWCEGRKLDSVKLRQMVLTEKTQVAAGESIDTQYGKVIQRGSLSVIPQQGGRFEIRYGIWEFSLKRVTEEERLRASQGPKFLLSQVTGVVHAQIVREGAWVDAKQPLCVVESLKRLIPHAVPLRSRVVRFLKHPGSWVTQGEAVAQIEVVDSSPGA